MSTENLTLNSEIPCSIDCSYRPYGSGKITKITCSETNGKPDLLLDFESPVRNTKIGFTAATTGLKYLTLDTFDQLELENILTEYAETWYELDATRKAEAEAKRQAQRATELQAIADKKAQARLEAGLAKLETMQPEDIKAVCKTPQKEYEVIGWLARHCTNIKPSMPAEAQGWFERKFGKVENAKIYEPGARTSGNNPMKYSLSIEGAFNADVPVILSKYVSGKNPRHISSVEFFWALIDDYGFQFGKKQDFHQIRSYVPNEYMADFDRGLAM